MTSPTRRLTRRRAVLAALAALLFGVVLVAVAGQVDVTTESSAAPERIGSPAHDGPRGMVVDATARHTDPAAGRHAATRTAERTHLRLVLIAIATTFAALGAALAAIGQTGVPGVGRRRRLGAAPLGARAPPAALAA